MKSGIDGTSCDPKIHHMTTTFPTEEIIAERGAALLRIKKQQREEKIILKREMDRPIWKDGFFWLSCLLLFGSVNGAKLLEQSPHAHEAKLLICMVLMAISLDRASRRRARAARELAQLQDEAGVTRKL